MNDYSRSKECPCTAATGTDSHLNRKAICVEKLVLWALQLKPYTEAVVYTRVPLLRIEMVQKITLP